MQLYPHQQKLIDENPKKALLVWEARTGKSLPTAMWLKKRIGERYVICLKQNKEEWKRHDTGGATVITKEEFKKLFIEGKIGKPTAIAVDEVHYFGGRLFAHARSKLKRSDVSTCLYNLVQRNPNMDILILTATPVRQDAWSLHTLLCYIGIYYKWETWREEFFEKKQTYYQKFPIWLPKDDWRIQIRKYIDKHGNIVNFRDIVHYLPPIEDIIINIKHKVDKGERWTDEHQNEQKDKIEEILNIGYRKLIIVAYYTQQIDDLAKELSKYKNVYVLDGRTKDADEVKTKAQQDEDCFFIVQSAMGFGFDGYMFGAIVFCSMSHSCVHHTQMTGRLRHIQYLKNITHYYLIGGRWDKAIHECVMAGKDFNPAYYKY